MAATAPSPAPEETPMMSGEARGLRSTRWNRWPAIPKAIPVRIPSTVRGRVMSHTMYAAGPE